MIKPLILSFLVCAIASASSAQSILVQSTTSTKNSGLYDHLLPDFTAKTGIRVNVVAVGTGQAIRNARNCDADVLLVHAKSAEEDFVASGAGVERFDLMYNDFVLVGPASDLAGVHGQTDIIQALNQIASAEAPFASRSDDSGTHKKEVALWAETNAKPWPFSGDWYLETGSGMGATLNTGVGLDAYVLTDRATWISFGNKQDFLIHVEGDPKLFNQYGVIQVNPDACPNVDAASGQAFIEWLLSPEGQSKIAAYKVDDQQLFFPNAGAGE